MEQKEISQEITFTTAVIAINPQLDAQFLNFEIEAGKILDYAKSHHVNSDIEVKSAVNDLAIISGLRKGIEEKRQEYVRPINEHVKAVNATFKLLTDPIEQADKITREKITAYRAEVDRKRREAEAINQAKEDLARREAALSGTGEITVDVTPVIIPDASPAHVRAEAATLGTAKVWKWEVTDFKALPDDFKVADLVKIGKVIRAGVNIPGVKAWQEDSIRISASR